MKTERIINNSKINFALLLFYLTLNSYGQENGKAYYYTKSIEHGKSNNISEGNSPDGKNLNRLVDNMEFVLTFNKEFAKYELNNAMSLTTDNKLSLIFSGYLGPYFFDFKNKDVYRIQEDYLIRKEASSIKWKLTKEKLELNGFTCFKATAEMEFRNRSRIITKPVVAWYAPKISVNACPNGFLGLPGLIIQLEYRNTITTLRKIKYYNKPLKVSIPKNYITISEEEFREIIRELIRERDKNKVKF